MTNITNEKTFGNIKRITEGGAEFWSARELQEILQYKEWRNFEKVIYTAKIACKISQQEVEDHFVEVNKIVDAGATKKPIRNYNLTRYACYLIVMNGDPRKEVIAHGQTYFAVKTRQQEFQELFEQLNEDEKRLFIRADIKQKNMILAESARNAGVITNLEFAQFQDAGYMGLYGGETHEQITYRKGVDDKNEILDYMGSEELAANLFRITQTDAALKRNKVATAKEANQTHYEVGRKVRKAIKDIGGTMPEQLPLPDKSIKEIEKEKKGQIKRGKQTAY